MIHTGRMIGVASDLLLLPGSADTRRSPAVGGMVFLVARQRRLALGHGGLLLKVVHGQPFAFRI